MRSQLVAIGLMLIGGLQAASAGTLPAGQFYATVGIPNPAEIVQINYTDGGGTHNNVSVYSGLINWTITSPTGFDPLKTFCVDISHDIYVGSNYSYKTTTNLAALGGFAQWTSTSSPTVGTVIDDIEHLYANHYDEVIQDGTNAAAAEFQMAIWKLVYGSTSIGFSSSSSSYTATTDQWVQDAKDPGGLRMNLLGMQSYNNNPAAQDQIIADSSNVTLSIPTPLLQARAGGSILLVGLAAVCVITRSGRGFRTTLV